MSCEGHMLLHFIYARIRWTDWSTSLFTRFFFASDARISASKTSMAGCVLSWSSNVLSDFLGNHFNILHVCIKEFHFLRNLKLEDCKLIREITCKLPTLYAKQCKSVKYMDRAEECYSLRELLLDDFIIYSRNWRSCAKHGSFIC